MRIKSFNSSLIGTLDLRVTSFLLNNALSLFFNKVSLLLFCLISDAFSNKVSKLLYLFISSAAVLIPIPGTPGILSDESPAKDCTSITLTWFHPKLFNNFFFSNNFILHWVV